MNDAEKIDVLRMVHDTHRAEVIQHREAMAKTNQWSTGLYIAIAAGLLTASSSTVFSLTEPMKMFIVFVTWIITLLFISQTLHSRDAIDTNARIIVLTDEALSLFEEGVFLEDKSIYPKKWRQWGKEKGAGYYHNYSILFPVVMALAITILIFLI